MPLSLKETKKMAKTFCKWASLLLLTFCILCSMTTSILALNVTPPSSSRTSRTSESALASDHKGEGNNINSSDFTEMTFKVADLMGSRWFEQNQKIIVYHSIEVVDAMLIDKNQLSLRIEFYLQQRWTMTGVKLPKGLFKKDDPPHFFITAKESVLQNMWSPDSYISTSRDSGTVKSTALKSVVYIYPDMTIIYRAKMFANVACTTNFTWYPLDKHACLLAIEGYTYHDEFVKYQWEDDKERKAVSTKMERPLQYDLHGVNISSGSVKRGNPEVMYPYVSIKFKFERKMGNSLFQIYIPTTLVVILASFNFWIGLDAVPARMSLVITALLTLVTMHIGQKGSIPPVHYVTMMDIWMVGCMTFVFFAVCEFILVKYMHWRLHKVPENKVKVSAEEEEKKLNEWVKIMRASLAPSPVPEEEDQENQNRSKIADAGPEIVKESFKSLPPHQALTEGQGDRRRSEVSVSLNSTMLEEMELNNYRYRRPRIGEKVNIFRCLAGHQLWVKIDMCCTVFFPVAFCIFNCIYWPVLFKACKREAYITL